MKTLRRRCHISEEKPLSLEKKGGLKGGEEERIEICSAKESFPGARG